MLKPNNGPHPEIPGKTRQLYPTAAISDLEVIEEINCLPEDYEPLAPETAHPDNARTGFALILVSQGPSRLNPATKMERVYMSLPGAWVSTTRIDPDGMVVTIKTRKQLSRLIVSGESFASGVWTKTTNGQGGDAVLGDEVVETRAVPGNWVTRTRIDADGAVVTIRTRKQAAASITSGETLTGAIWTRTTNGAAADALIGDEIVETRAIPGDPITTQTISPQDGASVTETRRMVAASGFAAADTLVSTTWTRTFSEKIDGTDLVLWQVTQVRAIPGDPLTSQSISKDGDVTTETRTLFAAAGFVASSLINSGTWTRTFDERVDGTDLVVWKVVQVRATQATLAHYVAEIPERSIPPKLRSALPTTTTEITEKGTASLPTLSTGDFYRSEQQLDQYSYRKKIVNLSLSALPVTVTDKGVTERFGGGPTTLTYTLSATLGTVDEGLLVLSSKIDILGNGLYLKTTEARDGAAWPLLHGGEFDELLQTVVPFTQQVVAEGGSGSVAGDVVTEVKPIDDWRSQQIIRTLPTATIDAYSRILHNNCNVDLPLQLISAAADTQSHSGGAAAGDSATSYTLGGHGSGGMSLRASAQASMIIIPDVKWLIKAFRGNGLPCYHVLFYVAVGASRAAILTRLAAILGGSVAEYPNFSPQPVTIRCAGKHTSIRWEQSGRAYSTTIAKFDGTFVTSGESRSEGNAIASEIGVNQKRIHIPPSVHGAIAISGNLAPSDQSDATSTVNALAWGGSLRSVIVHAPADGTIICDQSGTGTIPATPGTTAVPSSGLYLTPRGIVSEPDRKYGRIRVFAEVVDASLFI